MKTMRRFVVLVLALTLCVGMSMGVGATTRINPHISYYAKEDVEDYIVQAFDVEQVTIGDQVVTYYYGDDFIVIQQRTGYQLAVRNAASWDILLNGKVTSRLYKDRANDSLLPETKSATPSSKSGGTFVREYYQIRVSLAGVDIPAVRALMILNGFASWVADEVVGYCYGKFVDWIIPHNYYVTLYCAEYLISYDANMGTRLMRFVHSVWGGTSVQYKTDYITGWENTAWR